MNILRESLTWQRYGVHTERDQGASPSLEVSAVSGIHL